MPQISTSIHTRGPNLTVGRHPLIRRGMPPRDPVTADWIITPQPRRQHHIPFWLKWEIPHATPPPYSVTNRQVRSVPLRPSLVSTGADRSVVLTAS